MASPLFQLPRELRNKIYELANYDEKPFANFEIPWCFTDFVEYDTSEEKSSLDRSSSNAPGTVKISADDDKQRMKLAHAIIDHPMAFTCKQAMMEHVEEYQHHTGKLPPVALVATAINKLWSIGEIQTKVCQGYSSEDWIGMITNGVLPSGSRIRVHLRFDIGAFPKHKYDSVHQRLDRLSMYPLQGASELEFKTNEFSIGRSMDTWRWSFGEFCENHFSREGAPTKILVVWPCTSTGLVRIESTRKSKVWEWVFEEAWSGVEERRRVFLRRGGFTAWTADDVRRWRDAHHRRVSKITCLAHNG